jgi:hypothetical protein
LGGRKLQSREDKQKGGRKQIDVDEKGCPMDKKIEATEWRVATKKLEKDRKEIK